MPAGRDLMVSTEDWGDPNVALAYMQVPFTVETDGQHLRGDFPVLEGEAGTGFTGTYMELIRGVLLDWAPIEKRKVDRCK
jgi:hypothetical protein